MEYYCNVCKQTISEKVYEYSINYFGKALCIAHQRANKPEPLSYSFCRAKISQKVYEYSVTRFGKPLCWEHQKNATNSESKSSKMRTQPKILRHCSDCNRIITLAVFEFSMKKFGMPLCRTCQPYTERKKKYRRSSAPPKRELTKTSPIEVGSEFPKDKKYYNGY